MLQQNLDLRLSQISRKQGKLSRDQPIHSGVFLKLNVYSKLGNGVAEENFEEESKFGEETFTITFTVTYAGKETSWTESCTNDFHKSLEVTLEYVFGRADQTITVEVQAVCANSDTKTKVEFEMH